MDLSAQAVAVFDKLAGVYQDKFMYLDLYNDTYDLFCDHLTKQHAEILELACGPGNITKYMLAKRPDFNILATDMSPNMIRLAKANNPEAEVRLMDCRDIAKLDKKYDGLVAGFCLPYLDKETTEKLIADAAGILNDRGLIYLSTIEGPYNTSGPEKSSRGDEIYMHYYTAEDMLPALTSNGFELIALERKHFRQEGYEASTHLIIIARHTVNI